MHFCKKLINAKNQTPVVISRTYDKLSLSELQLYSASDIEVFFIDGLGDGIYLSNNETKLDSSGIKDFNSTASWNIASN